MRTDKTITARLLADDPSEVDRRFETPFPLNVPPDELPGGCGEFTLRKWQSLALDQIARNQRGQIHMQAEAGKKTLIAKICSYTPKPRNDWPDFRVLVAAKDTSIVRQIWRLCVGEGLDVGLLVGHSTSEDEQSRIVCSTAASLPKLGGEQFDAVLAYSPYDLITPSTCEVFCHLRSRRVYGFADCDEIPQYADADRIEIMNHLFGPVLLSRHVLGRKLPGQ